LCQRTDNKSYKHFKYNERNRNWRSKFEDSKNYVSICNVFNEVTNFRKKITFPITKLVDKNVQDVIDQNEICNLLSKEYILEKSSSNLNCISDEVNDYCSNYSVENSEYKMKTTNNEEVLKAILDIKKCNNSKDNAPICIYKKFAQFLWKLIVLLDVCKHI